MKTKHQTLRDNNIKIDRLNEDKPMLVNGILRAMVEYAEAYHKYKLANGAEQSDSNCNIPLVSNLVCQHQKRQWIPELNKDLCLNCGEFI